MMDRTQWEQLSALLDEALDLAPSARATWLEQVCTEQPALAPALRRMLAQAERAEAQPEAAQALVTAFDQWLGPALVLDDDAGAASDLRGLHLGAWVLAEKIGEGGMGQVWRANRADGLFQGEAAIKLLRADLPAERFSARFARERAVLARLNHPAIAHLLDAGIAQGQAYLVLELVRGRPLSEHVRLHAPLLAQRVALLRSIAQAVEAAHAQLVIHRDLKPSNVLVTDAGQPKLLDFGVAGLLDDDAAADDLTRLTGRGLTVGYAAPEQLAGQPVGTAADVFSLGVMLFELVSGALPFGAAGDNRATLERAVMETPPHRLLDAAPAPGGPGPATDAGRARGDLEAVIAKALHKDPAQRYRNVSALIEDLDHWSARRPVRAQRRDWRHDSLLWLRRHALLAASTAIVTCSLAIGLGSSLWQWQRATEAARQSDEVTAYLQELLASASPDRHGGEWPTVLQLLRKAREDVMQRFGDSPGTRLRVLQVLVATNQQLNRHDIAQPLARELVALSVQIHGEESAPTLKARLDQSRSWILQGQPDLIVESIAPAIPRLRRVFGADSDELLNGLMLLDAAYARLGRTDEAAQALAQAWEIIQTMQGPEAERLRASYLNHLSIVQSAQGHLREAIATLQRTQVYWGRTEPNWQREVLTYQRNLLALQIRAGDYGDIEPRLRSLLPRIDALMKPGSGLNLSLRHELGRFLLETGRWPEALRQREDDLAYAQAAGVVHPITQMAMRAQRLQLQGLTHALPAVDYAAQARALMQQLQREQEWLGLQRVEIRLALARGALALDLGDLATELIEALRQEPGVRDGWDRPVRARVDRLAAQLARWRGDLPEARRLLQGLLGSGPAAARPTLDAWSTALDHAWLLQQQSDPAAAQALAEAQQRRPPAVPPGHPLDQVQAYLASRLQTQDPVAGRAAQAAILRAQGALDGRSGAGRASLFGALI
ncbi:serine/threonine protein kinase [Ideonella sp. 4Y11]|uniref:Serine/threonine protein kinase n=1 Tax=Ideonella aquatica TaxID=2824119 RepID=A0A940YFX2_9BURK|nr:serine/threonine-protein kinase [Ideonella aquatica]MBQ0958614.1 serine/threonine protein kinase [Ideonella aquatica]